MERRTFIKSAFGLVVLTAGAAVFGARAISGSSGGTVLFTTAQGVSDADAVGPLMQNDIELVERDGHVVGCYGGTDLFDVDRTGATLISLADGTRSIDDITQEAADEFGMPVEAADVASFFVVLGQSGYLQNEVLVNLVEVQA